MTTFHAIAPALCRGIDVRLYTTTTKLTGLSRVAERVSSYHTCKSRNPESMNKKFGQKIGMYVIKMTRFISKETEQLAVQRQARKDVKPITHHIA